jgi:hypothetical protein
MKRTKFLVEPRLINKAKWIVIYFTDFGDIGLNEANTIKEVNRLVNLHRANSSAFEVYKI